MTFITTHYTEAEQNAMRKLSGGRLPGDDSLKCYTTFNPADDDVGGCGHLHRRLDAAENCVKRLKLRHSEHRLIVGFDRMVNTPKIRELFPLGKNVDARNAEAIDVVVPPGHFDGDGSGEPAHLDKKARIGKHRGKTWRSLTESESTRDYLKWATLNALDRRPGSPYPSLGEMAAPVLKWWQMQQGQDNNDGEGSAPSGAAGASPSSGEGSAATKPKPSESDGGGETGKPATGGEQQQQQPKPQSGNDTKTAAQEIMDSVKMVASAEAARVVREEGIDKVEDKVAEAIEQSQERLAEIVKETVEALAPRPLHVTTPDKPEGEIVEGQHPKFELLLRTIAAGCTRVWVAGPAGSGKTTAAKKVADVLGRKFFLQTPIADKFEAFGFIDAGGKYQDTEMYRWAKAEPGAVLLIDEIDASMPQAVVSLNSLTDKEGWAIFPNGEKLQIPEEHVIVVTANTWGTGPDAEYVGRAGQDGAMRNRFPRRIPWDYDADFERKLVLGLVGGAKAEWITASQLIRHNLNESRIKIVWSPRDTMDLCRMLAAGVGWKEGIESSALAQLKPDQLRKAVEGVRVSTGSAEHTDGHAELIETSSAVSI